MLGVKAYNSFGMTEMNGPGVAFECTEQNGMHFWEDCYLVEIINPETGEPVPDGEIGELVLTTLDREMMPLIRYRTRDLTRILPGECPCGRTHLRIDITPYLTCSFLNIYFAIFFLHNTLSNFLYILCQNN